MFASLQHRRKLDEATSSTDDVTPVYLLEEIWQTIHGSGPDVAQAYVEGAHKRLGHKSPVVKQKALRVIKYVCSKGSSDFKRAIAKHATAIRELTHYKGEPDPFKGDTPNQKVRESAKEALDAVFSATDISYSASASSGSQLQGRIQGFGSTVGESGMSTGGMSSNSSISSNSYAPSISGSGTNRYQGFGNPRFENRPSGGPASSARDTASAWVSSGISQVKDLVGNKRPGILRDEEKSGYSSDEGGMGSTYRVPGPPPAPIFPSAAAAPTSQTAADGSEEERLVESICSRGGLRAQPDREALRLFVESLANLSGAKVAQQLQHKIEHGGWQEMLRALCALEAVVQQGASASCGECAVHFQSDPSCIKAACKSPQVSVRQRALKVMQLVGGDASAAAPATAVPAPTANGHQQPMTDLLGSDPDEPPAAASASAAAVGPDLLGNLLDPVGEPSSAAAAPQGMGGLFTGLDVGSGPTSSSGREKPHQQGQQHASKAPNPQSAGDLFGGLTAAVPANGLSTSQQPASASGDMFGGLSLAGASAAPSSSAAPMLDDIFSTPTPTANGNTSPFPPLSPAPTQTSAQRPSDPLAGLNIHSGTTSTSQASSQGLASMLDFAAPAPGGPTRGGSMGSQGFPPMQNGGPRLPGALSGMPGAGMGGAYSSSQGMSQVLQPGQPGGPQWPPGMGMGMGMPGFPGQPQLHQQQPQMPQQLGFPGMQPNQQPPNLVYMPGMQAAMYGGPIPGGLPPAQFAYIQRMMGANFPGHSQPGQQPPPSFGYGPTPPQRSGSNSSSGAIPADAFAQPTSAGRTVSDLMGREIVTKKDTFDFVTDHLDTLKISK